MHLGPDLSYIQEVEVTLTGILVYNSVNMILFHYIKVLKHLDLWFSPFLPGKILK